MNKFGKKVDMRKINRDLNYIRKLIKDVKDFSENNKVNILGKNRNCSICYSNSYNYFLNVYGYTYCECLNCGSIFLLEILDSQNIYKNESSDYLTVHNSYMSPEILKERIYMISEPKVNYILETIEADIQHSKVWIDIGCGVGEILSVVSKWGGGIFKPIGIEANMKEIEFGESFVNNEYVDKKNKINFINGFIDVKSKNMKINKYLNEAYLVSFFNVLEHIYEPSLFIDYIYSHVKKGTFLVFEVPRHPSLNSFSNLTYSQGIYRSIAPDHLQIFTEKAVDIMLQNKFEIISKWGFGQGFFDILNNSMLSSNTNNIKLYNQLVDISNDVQEVIDRKGFSDSMIFIARRI